MGVHKKPLDFSGYANPDTARRELERQGFRRRDNHPHEEIYLCGHWHIERLEAGRDLWSCQEGETRWYTGRLEMALQIANQSHHENTSAAEKTRHPVIPTNARPQTRQ